MSRNQLLALFVLLLTVYMFSAGGHLYSIDEVLTYSTTREIADAHSLNIAPDLPFIKSLGGLTQLPDNTSIYYSKYSLLQSLLALPFYYLGKLAGVPPWRMIGLFYGPIISSISGCLVFVISRKLGSSSKWGLAIALTYAFTSIAWPYAKEFQEVTTATLFGLVTVFFLLDSMTKRGASVLAGIFAALSVFGRSSMLVVLPAYIIYLSLRPNVAFRARLRNLSMFLFPLVLGGAAYAYLNWVRFGSPLAFGSVYEFTGSYLNPTVVWTNPLVGVYGMLLSPGEGLFIYYPVCAIGLIAILFSTRLRSHERLMFGLIFLSNLLFFGRLEFWHGWVAWGARYLVTSTPYLYLGLSRSLEDFRSSLTKTVLLLLAAGGGFLSNLLGSLVNFLYTVEYLSAIGAFAPGEVPYPGIWIPAFSPLRGSWDLLWSSKYPSAFFSSAPDIYYLKARLDLFYYVKFGPLSLVAFVLLLLFASVWVMKLCNLHVLQLTGDGYKPGGKVHPPTVENP